MTNPLTAEARERLEKLAETYRHSAEINEGLREGGVSTGWWPEGTSKHRLTESGLRALLSAYDVQAAEIERLHEEWHARERADALYRSRWRSDPLMKLLDDIRHHFAGLRPQWSEALAEHQARTFEAEARVVALHAQLDAAREVIEPFAKAGGLDEHAKYQSPDEAGIGNGLVVGDLRRAAAFLKSTETKT